MKSELTNEMINSIEVLENLKDSFETPAIDYVINSIKEAIKSMGERANYVNDNLNRTRIVLRILIDVNSFNKNDEEFNQNFNEVIEILNNEIEKEKENEKNIRR